MKPIVLDEKMKATLFAKMQEALEKFKGDGNFSFTAPLIDTGDKAVVVFEPTAYYKMRSLVDGCSDEIGWHGVCERAGKRRYIIKDILVYPQTVTGATVTTDQVEYQNWLYAFPDEVFNHIRFQGHSHVNMSVSPSATDNGLYKSLLDDLSDEDFYVFLITNKRGEMNFIIYDMAENVMFDKNDVLYFIGEVDPAAVKSFSDESMKLVKKEKPKATTTSYSYSAYSYGNAYGNYGAYGGVDYYGRKSLAERKNDKAIEQAAIEAADEYYNAKWEAIEDEFK